MVSCTTSCTRRRQRRRVSNHCFCGSGHGTRFVINDTRNDGRICCRCWSLVCFFPPFHPSFSWFAHVSSHDPSKRGGILSAGRIFWTRTRVFAACRSKRGCDAGYYQAIMKGSSPAIQIIPGYNVVISYVTLG